MWIYSGRGKHCKNVHNIFLEGQAQIPNDLWKIPLANGYHTVFDEQSKKYLCLHGEESCN